MKDGFWDAVNKLQLTAPAAFEDLEGDHEHHYIPLSMILLKGRRTGGPYLPPPPSTNNAVFVIENQEGRNAWTDVTFRSEDPVKFITRDLVKENTGLDQLFKEAE